MSGLLQLVRESPGADTLFVTNMWPEHDRPVYGIHAQRFVDAVAAAGRRFDVLYIRGYASPLAYAEASACFAWRATSPRRYRLIHAYSGEAALAVRFQIGTPMLASYCGDDVLGDRRSDGTVPASSRLRAQIIRRHSVLFRRTITKSREMEAVLPHPERNTVIPNGVDVDLYRPMPREEARARLGWDPTVPTVLFVATKPYAPAKRLALAQAACERARASVAGIRLEIAAGVDPATVPVLMNAADCLLQTSAVEGSPNAVKEAVMCGLPVVATPAGDIAELLAGVEPSWLVDPNPDALADALVRCLSDPRRSNGHVAAASLAWDRIARRVLRVYEEVEA